MFPLLTLNYVKREWEGESERQERRGGGGGAGGGEDTLTDLRCFFFGYFAGMRSSCLRTTIQMGEVRSSFSFFSFSLYLSLTFPHLLASKSLNSLNASHLLLGMKIEWKVNIASGTNYILTMLDGGAIGNGGSSNFMLSGTSNDTSCMDAAACVFHLSLALSEGLYRLCVGLEADQKDGSALTARRGHLGRPGERRMVRPLRPLRMSPFSPTHLSNLLPTRNGPD